MTQIGFEVSRRVVAFVEVTFSFRVFDDGLLLIF